MTLTLYWHKWVHSRGTVYHLHAAPQTGPVTERRCGETAIVHRIAGRWQASWQDAEGRSGWCSFGAPGPARQWVERELDRLSIGLFGTDAVIFEGPSV